MTPPSSPAYTFAFLFDSSALVSYLRSLRLHIGARGPWGHGDMESWDLRDLRDLENLEHMRTWGVGDLAELGTLRSWETLGTWGPCGVGDLADMESWDRWGP